MIKFNHKILSSIVKNSKIKNLFILVYCPPQGLIFNIKIKNLWQPGVEPGLTDWRSDLLTIRALPQLKIIHTIIYITIFIIFIFN